MTDQYQNSILILFFGILFIYLLHPNPKVLYKI
uniref:Uncharacterized protein n=1 Tax=viral metagenome TaxID=1070528 RepID=A0A6C0D7Z8_9ZZZZ